MARKTGRAKLIMSEAEYSDLQEVLKSRKRSVREVERAKILLRYYGGQDISAISVVLKVSRKAIYKCIDKALSAGVYSGLKDKPHRPKDPVITEEAKAWVMNIACSKPMEYGYPDEIWSHRKLSLHVRKNSSKAGYDCLKSAAKATVQRILKEHCLQPHKIKYYLEKRDPEFERKMQDVLSVYQEINLQNQSGIDTGKMITVSVDEKPGVQALEGTSRDLMPDYKKGYKQTSRDYEYKRLGTISILAALDLHSGHVIAQVHDRHRSKEFIELLRELDGYYPKKTVIRIILDNHSAHISKETMKYLTSKPNRFQYIHTPKHGSWLNLVESLFSKMARTFLKYIRVSSKEELKIRILLWVKEVNDAPVIFSWKNFEFAETIL